MKRTITSFISSKYRTESDKTYDLVVILMKEYPVKTTNT